MKVKVIMKKHCAFLCFSLANLLILGCSSFSTFQTSEVTPPGEVTIGGGISSMGESGDYEGDIIYCIPEIYGRYGISDNLDVGVKYTFPLTVSSDIKYQFIKTPLPVALDFGMALLGFVGDNSSASFITLYPQVLASTEKFYFGLKTMYIRATATAEDETESFDSGLLGGACVGFKLDRGRFSLMPELNYLIGITGDAGEAGTKLFQGGMGFSVTF